ncbi:hypothetical protein ASPCAL02865 [Aspergillus calidoustus]|uniref:AB hydrolase-1 domain-containing protein n=1 Tax=Aspergillus calidoustus TaxID=454130 RepID=A0A0U5GLK6_ASPCI|nr:hypothetical protein ASPCAL02865 [Aspergillus calidoustus]
MNDDATATRAVTTKLADEGHQVVLVMHSYGGIPGTESAEELGCEFCQNAGKPGGSIALVYLAAYFLTKGMGHMVLGGLIFHDKMAALETFYNDFTPEMDPLGWESTLQTQSATTMRRGTRLRVVPRCPNDIFILYAGQSDPD